MRSIVVSALEEIDCVIGDAVHQTVFLSDSPRPAAAEQVFQRFGFPRAFEGVPHDRIHEIQNSHGDRALVFDPKSKILKKLGLKYRDAFSLSPHPASLSAKQPFSRV